MLTVADVARELKVSAKLIYALCSRGTLAHYRVGGRIRVSDDQLKRYLETQKREGAAPPPPVMRKPKLSILDL